jgi:hypothetical protein
LVIFHFCLIRVRSFWYCKLVPKYLFHSNFFPGQSKILAVKKCLSCFQTRWYITGITKPLRDNLVTFTSLLRINFKISHSSPEDLSCRLFVIALCRRSATCKLHLMYQGNCNSLHYIHAVQNVPFSVFLPSKIRNAAEISHTPNNT